MGMEMGMGGGRVDALDWRLMTSSSIRLSLLQAQYLELYGISHINITLS